LFIPLFSQLIDAGTRSTSIYIEHARETMRPL
jgi:hypothetical protein